MAAQPPPLKARGKRKSGKAPPLPKSRVIEEAIDALEADPSLDEQEPVEEDPAEGEWLFKEDDMVKGPVPAEVLVKRIAEDALDGKTKIAREMGKWIPLAEVSYFAEALAAAAERKRVEAELARIKAAKSKRLVLRVAAVVAILLVPSVAGAVVGRQVMILKPWDDSEEWIQRAPPLVELPKPPPKFAKVDPPPEPEPTETEADGPSEGTDDGDKVDGDDGKKASSKGRRSRRSRRGKKSRDKKGKDKKGKETKVAKAEPAKEAVTSGKDLPRTLSTKQVMKGLNKGAGGFKRCVKAEMDRNPDIPGRITLAFSVSNDGTAINVKLLERQVRKGPLASCIKKSMAKLRWPKFYGERPYAEVPFNISKPKEKRTLRKKP